MAERSKASRIAARNAEQPGGDTRAAILLAAEGVFADKGYNGATMREVAQAANANLGLINYYFGSKEKLFIAAIECRYAVLHDSVMASVEAVMARPSYRVDEAVRAFLEPIVGFASTEGDGWRNYLRLLARGMNVYNAAELHPALVNLASIADILRNALNRTLGLDQSTRLQVPGYLMESAIIYITQDQGLLDARSEGRFTALRVDAILDEMVTFFTAGFLAFVQPKEHAA